MFKVKAILIIFILVSFSSCGFFKSDQVEVTGNLDGEFFEGEIILEKEHTIVIYLISKNIIKRQEGSSDLLNKSKILGETYGLIVNVKDEKVTVYDDLGSIGKSGTFSLQTYKSYLKAKNTSLDEECACDLTYTYFDSYLPVKATKDSIKASNMSQDYHLYKEGDYRQHVFDTKSVKIKRELLKTVFPALPAHANFPLQSELIHLYKHEDKGLQDAFLNKLKDRISNLIAKEMKLRSITRRKVTTEELGLPKRKFTVYTDLNKYTRSSPTIGHSSGGGFDID